MTTYAIIDTDGTRLVYWGIGATPAAARIDAEAQEGYAETEHGQCVEVTPEIAAIIHDGDVAVRR